MSTSTPLAAERAAATGAGAAAPVLRVTGDGGSHELAPGAVVGRAEADLVVDHGLVSRRHAQLLFDGATWSLLDLGSRNGVHRGDQRQQLVALPAGTTTAVRLGDPVTGPELRLTPGPAPAGPGAGRIPRLPVGSSAAVPARLPTQLSGATAAYAPRGTTGGRAGGLLRLGRDADNDVVIDDLLVSRHHAEVRLAPDGRTAEVVDLGSSNGVFVNGQRTSRAVLGPRDVLTVGRAQYALAGGVLVEQVDNGRIGFAAVGVGVTVPPRQRGGQPAVLLDDVSITLEQSSLLAVVGPSGAGKSTLLGALTGFRPAGRGRVLYDGRDLYADYAALRHRIGFVPQDDVLHPQLTVRRALGHAARLRFGEDTTAAERSARVEEVIAELGLADQADLRVDRLSGGQRKRTSVALELLTRPSLLFLDEPTSGLDPGLDKQVMGTLRELADGGRTVVVVTHSVANLAVCDRVLVMAPGGRVAYFGPPEELLAHFGADDHADVFLALQRDRTGWAQRWCDSPDRTRWGGAPSEGVVTTSLAQQAGGYQAPPRRQRALTQLLVLARRYLEVVAADRQYAAFLAALPVALALLARIVPAPHGLVLPEDPSDVLPGAPPNPQALQLLLVLVISGALLGTATAVRELVKEREVYRRERSVGLSPVAYLASKAVVLSAVVVGQSVLLVALALAGRDLPPDALALGWGPAELAAAVALVAVASMCLGLLVSAVVGTGDQAMPLMVLVVMAQIVFSGALFPVDDRVVLEQLAWASPTRWGFVQLAGTTDLAELVPGADVVDPLWASTGGQWWASAGFLGAVALVALVLALVRLRRLDPAR